MTNLNEKEIIAERILTSSEAISSLSGKIEQSVIEVADIVEKIEGSNIHKNKYVFLLIAT